MIAVIDYGAGNVGSVLKAVRHLGYSAAPATSPAELKRSEKILLPGQGHFGQMMKALEERQFLTPLRQGMEEGKPFLGICLGLQALYEGSEEAPGVAGLGILPGRVTRFEGVFKVPHVGWNELQIRRPSKLLDRLSPSSFVYYCHSYYCQVNENTTAVAEYGQTFAAVVEEGNVFAVQFHPEKSGEAGLRVLENFLEMD
jgi:imidazole glycerol phosphate synthase glutamine amidotransferase subunit